MTVNCRNHVVIGVGSNSPERALMVERAIDMLRREFSHVKASHIYNTPPFGAGTANYSNAVVTADTPMSADEVNALLKQYELEHGRDAASRLSGVVTIDLDLVYFNADCLRPHEITREYYLIGARSIEAPC